MIHSFIPPDKCHQEKETNHNSLSDKPEKKKIRKLSSLPGATDTPTGNSLASSHIMARNHQMLDLLVRGTSLNMGTPCAACKLLRRRCAPDCPFAPYFSPHEPQKFAAVHKVFGASNASKMIMEVPEARRADTANSLIFEASARLIDPVYGCMGAILALQRQVQSLQAELIAVREEILEYKLIREVNSLVTINSHNHMISNNFIYPFGSPSPVAAPSLTRRSQPQPQQTSTPPVLVATSAGHLIPDGNTSSLFCDAQVITANCALDDSNIV